MVRAIALAAASVLALAQSASPQPHPVARGLAFPTNLAFTPDGRLLFTEKETGNVRAIDLDDDRLEADPVASFRVTGEAERGLLGIAVDPAFASRPWIYVYFSDAASGRNRLVRFRADRPSEAHDLLVGLESASGYHNGGDIVFGPDGMLYLSIGEAHDADRAQDPDDLGGKIVRLEPDGDVPPGAPFGTDNPVWSLGHRNSFGLCVDPATGELWETENGPDRDDEVNLIERGANYGWPDVMGRADVEGFVDPVAVFPDTVALTGCAVVDGDLYVGAFNDATLYRMAPGDRSAGTMRPVAVFDAGITDVAAGPDGRLYVATSDAIWTIAPSGASPTSTPTVPSPAVVAPSPTPAGGSDDGGRPWIAAVAAAVIAVGLGLRFAAGRRLRREDRAANERDGPDGPD